MSIPKGVSKHGSRLYIESGGKNDLTVSKGGFASGGVDRPAIVLPGNVDMAVLWDDFHGDTGQLVSERGWNYVTGDTGQNEGLAAGQTGFTQTTNGVFRIGLSHSIAAGAQAPANGAVLTNGLQWKADGSGAGEGRLRMSARVKLSQYDLARSDTGKACVFVGFTDVASTVEIPIYDTGAGVISTATDAVGFILGSRADTGWAAAAVNNNTDATVVVVDTGVEQNVWDVLEVEIHQGQGDTGGTATFWVNGQPKGSISSPIGTDVALTPVVAAFMEDSGQGVNIDIDYINVAAPRDTGE
jgi:hypothetical protein